MLQILLGIHLLICIALTVAILLQRSEGGGALGMGGGPSGVMSGRGAANFMTRTTSILGGIFFLTSIGLTILASQGSRPAGSIMQDGSTTPDGIPTKAIDLGPAPSAAGGNAVGGNAVAPAAGGIPASSAAPPAPSPFGPAPTEPAKEPATEPAK